jgi:hypothetical protein
MNMSRPHNKLIAVVVGAALCLPAALMADDNAQPQYDDNTIIYLGKVGVTGHKAIFETLQDIKVSLRQPYSTDPKLANVVVCRIDDMAGSNVKKWLTCGTNRNLAKNLNALHGTMLAAISTNGPTGGDGNGGSSISCNASECYTEGLSAIDTVLDNQPGKYLHVQVNASALLGLLRSIPDPAPGAVTSLLPQAATTAAPAATSAH